MSRHPPRLTPSPQARLIARGLRRMVKPRKFSRRDIPLIRALMHAFTRARLPAGVKAERVKAPVRGEWLRPSQPRRGRALLYLHGGGYISGAPRTHRAITARLAKRLGIAVFALDYRLAPEHPFPAALDDALAAWRWLLAQGYRADRIWLAGDSAGGGLALALMLAARQQALLLPAACALFSPWTDLACTGAAITENAGRCAWFMPAQVGFAAGLYAGATATDHPLVSPLYGDLAGLPPLLVHASDSELLRDDAVRLADRAAAAGVRVALHLWHGLPHAWPNFAGLMPEGDACLDETVAALLALPAK
ncbi:alpha/beta hydrolase fold domain-containing protein [Ferrovibrio sp.]|uniref:alpha/beta hydrolase fold domain-containing protein n=1 Tax=Ferrovibrio sp. TaxID=1917215 RepID=UPI00311D81D0